MFAILALVCFIVAAVLCAISHRVGPALGFGVAVGWLGLAFMVAGSALHV